MYITKSIFNAAACIGSIIGAVNAAAIDVSLHETAADQNQSLSKRKEVEVMEGVNCRGQSGVDGFFWCNQPPGMSSMTILTSYIETLNDSKSRKRPRCIRQPCYAQRSVEVHARTVKR